MGPGNKAPSLSTSKTTSRNACAVCYVSFETFLSYLQKCLCSTLRFFRDFFELQHASIQTITLLYFENRVPLTTKKKTTKITPSLIPPTVGYSPAYSAPTVHLLLARRYSAPVEAEPKKCAKCVGKESLVCPQSKEGIVNRLGTTDSHIYIYWKQTITCLSLHAWEFPTKNNVIPKWQGIYDRKLTSSTGFRTCHTTPPLVMRGQGKISCVVGLFPVHGQSNHNILLTCKSASLQLIHWNRSLVFQVLGEVFGLLNLLKTPNLWEYLES